MTPEPRICKDCRPVLMKHQGSGIDDYWQVELCSKHARLESDLNEMTKARDDWKDRYGEAAKSVSYHDAELREVRQQLQEALFESKFAMKLKDIGFDQRFLEEYRNQKMQIREQVERIQQLEQALRNVRSELQTTTIQRFNVWNTISSNLQIDIQRALEPSEGTTP